MAATKDVVVIGGGQAGLAAGYYLNKTNFNYLILDNQPKAGGAWQHYWKSLKLFSPREASSLPGMIMPPTQDTYPTREETIHYLKNYEERYQLPVQRPVKVKEVVQDEDGIFTLTTNAGNYQSRALISATGTWQNPFVPFYRGMNQFKGNQIHSAQYWEPSQFKDQRVLIIGGGNSAAQILAEVSKVATTIWVTREEPQFLPDDIDGHYLFVEASKLYKSGNNGTQKQPSIFNLGDIVMIPAVKEARSRGVLKSYRAFSHFVEHGIFWKDGAYSPIDAVIWCTGFKPALHHLRKLNIYNSNGKVAIKDNQSTQVANLWFLGYGNWTGYASATIIGVGRAAKQTVKGIEDQLKTPDP